MPTVVATVLINAPPDAVARVLLDAELAPLWTAGLERLELVEGEPGKPGCVGHAHYVEGGRRYVLTDALLRVVANRQFVSQVTGGGISAMVRTDLEPGNEGETQVTLRWRGRGTNPLTMLMIPTMRRRIRERVTADLNSLKKLAEAQRRTSTRSPKGDHAASARVRKRSTSLTSQMGS